mgnify:FL=1
MFPIRDHNPTHKTPFVTYALIALNLGIFISYYPMFSDARALNAFFFDWAMIPARITSGDGAYTLVTSQFLHGGIMHLAGNMLFLWIFGDNMEEQFGHTGFALFYLASGVIAALAQVVASPGSMVPTVGASGAIAGVMGGYLLLFPRAKVDILILCIVFFRVFTIPAFVMLGLWFGLQIFSGIGSNADMGGVAYWAHAGGFVAGLALTLPKFLKLGGMAFWARTHGHPPHPDAEYDLSRSNIPRVRKRR